MSVRILVLDTKSKIKLHLSRSKTNSECLQDL